jgi:phosphonate transport system ATP-binding protein
MDAVGSPTIRLERVTSRFGARCALDGVSTVIAPGQFVAILGRSGAGKTTLFRVLAGALPATEGEVWIGGRCLSALGRAELRAHRAQVGLVHQQFNLVRRLRVIDNVLIGRLPHLQAWRRWAALLGRFSPNDRAVALRALHQVGLVDRVWQRTDTLSGGEQQRVAIARILAQEPALILGDEPVASLDPANGALVMEILARVAATAGLTVICTLHQVEYARRYADRVLGLRNGRLVFDGSPGDLSREALRWIFDAATGGAPAVAAEPPEPSAAASACR